MKKWQAVGLTAPISAVCSIVVTYRVGTDPDMAVVEAVFGFAFLLAISWVVAGMVFLLSRRSLRPQTLVLICAVVSIAVAAWSIVRLSS